VGGGLPTQSELIDAAALRSWVVRLFEAWKSMHVAAGVLLQARLNEPELQEIQRARLLEGLEYWDRALDGLGMPAGKARRAESAVLNALFVGLFEMWVVSSVPLEEQGLIDRVTDLLWSRLSAATNSA
jgi:hypothetical protein